MVMSFFRGDGGVTDSIDRQITEMLGACRHSFDLAMSALVAGDNIDAIGDDVYEHLRVTDRQLLRRLQEKVIQRLRVDPSSDGRAATREGERVWQDIATAAELLMQVNRRAELREHDAATLRRLTEELRPLSPRARVTPELRARLSSLMGADPAIDGLLLAPADALIPVGVLRPNVSRLLATAQQLGW